MRPIGKLGMDFTTGSIPKLLIKFLAPLLLANILNSLYNTVDMIIIGQYVGSMGTVAVSLGGKMLTFLTFMATGLSSGGQILISQQMGAKKNDELSATIGTLFSLLGIISVLFGTLCLLFSSRLVYWLNTPEESISSTLSYLRITSAGIPLVFGYTAVSSVLRGMGDSKNPLLFIAIAAILNLILDVVFIAYFHLGATGTALATIIGQGFSFVISIILLYRKRHEMGFDFKLKSFVIDTSKMKIILGIGVPMAGQSSMIQLTQLFMMSFVNKYGLVQAAAYGIGDKIIHLLNVFTQSVQQAGGSMAGQNIGAGRQDRVTKLIKSALVMTFSIVGIISVFSLVFPEILFSLFTRDPEVLKYSFSFTLITALTLLLSSIMGSFSSVTTGTGRAGLSFLAGVLDGVIFRVAFSFILGIWLDMEVTGFFLANSLARLGPIIVHCSYYFSGTWKKVRRLTDIKNKG